MKKYRCYNCGHRWKDNAPLTCAKCKSTLVYHDTTKEGTMSQSREPEGVLMAEEMEQIRRDAKDRKKRNQMMADIDLQIHDEIKHEMRVQDGQWGPVEKHSHTDAEWNLILGKQIGQANDAVLRAGEVVDLDYIRVHDRLIEVEVVQAAAVLWQWLRDRRLRAKERGSR